MKTISEMAQALGRSTSYIWRLVRVFGMEPVRVDGRARFYDFADFKRQYDAGAYFV